MAKNGILSSLFSAALLMGILVCLICNIAISGSVTWSRIPVCSIVFAWTISFPWILLGKRGAFASLLSCSVFLIPYLFLLGRLTNVKEVFSVGAAVAAASIAFLWIIAAMFQRFGTARKLAALGVTFLLAVPFVILVNVILSAMIETPLFDMWDVLAISMLLLFASISFACDHAKKKGTMNQ